MRRVLAAVFLFPFLFACSDGNDNFSPAAPPPGEVGPTFSADIVWTEYGIPHVTATDWAGLGYGYGYAYATQNYCVVMEEFVRSAGESARYLGADGDLNLDFVMKLYNTDEVIQRIYFDAQPQRILDLGEGYVAGLNRYLNETGVDNLAEGEEGCRGAEWVREVDSFDLARLLHKRILRGSADPLADFMVAAEPPAGLAAAGAPALDFKAQLKQLAALDRVEARARLGLPEPEVIGSNAYAVGAEAVQGGNSGLLFGNPHFPWQGPDRFYMSHLTIPGEYDVMGAALHGLPLVVLGFNKDVAWSHTVSTAARFTFYELTLNPDNLLEYIYDGEIRALEPTTVSTEVLAADGSVETVEHTFWLSQYGPVLDLGELNGALGGWPNLAGTIIAYRDANVENLRGLDQWLKMGLAGDLSELKTELEDIGIPWVNTIAADRFGDALYSDISTVPHVSQQKIDSCVRGFIGPLLTDAGFVTLDGADSACEWGNDPGAPEGVFGYDSLPKLDTREYGANANDSYWLSNPRQLLEGFSQIIGLEGIEQSLRTRLTFVQAEERLDGSDGLAAPLFTNELVRQIHYSARNLPAELILADLVADCSAVSDWSTYSSSPVAVADACAILAAWDTRHTIDSTGGHIFYEFWLEVRSLDALWAVPFDAADPVNTPNTLNTADSTLMEAVRQGLADGVQRLLDNGIALDIPWGEVQFDERNGVRIPIHGGSGSMLHNVISSSLIDGEGYADIRAGNSYMQAVSWDQSDCPDANAVLTYSQSSDPTSAHYADATELYSQSGWIDMPFCEADRDAQEIGRASIEE
ncbi:MAG: penicillin acylase family protein [Halieaceae bacterium]